MAAHDSEKHGDFSQAEEQNYSENDDLSFSLAIGDDAETGTMIASTPQQKKNSITSRITQFFRAGKKERIVGESLDVDETGTIIVHSGQAKKTHSLNLRIGNFFRRQKTGTQPKQLASRPSPTLKDTQRRLRIGGVKERRLASEVWHYIVEGSRILLDHKGLLRKKQSHTITVEKFLAPTSRGKMVFASREVAEANRGSVLRISLYKEYPDGEAIDILRQFIARYEGKDKLLKSIDKRLFHKLSHIFRIRRSHLHKVFSYPYGIRKGNSIAKVMEALQKAARLHRQDYQFSAFIKDFHNLYGDKKQREFSTMSVKREDILQISRYLGKRQLPRFFLDLREELPIAKVMEYAHRMLRRMHNEYYTLRIVGQRLSAKPEWLQKVSPPVSMGIRRIEGAQIYQLPRFLSNYFWEYREKVTQLLTGHLIMAEIARDIAQKKQGGQTQELEDLLLPFEKIATLPPTRPYFNRDIRLKSAAFCHAMIALDLAALAAICLTSGSFLYHATQIKPILYLPPDQRLLFDLMGLALACWAAVSCWLSVQIFRRRERRAAIFHSIIWGGLCVGIFFAGGVFGYIHSLGIVSAVYMSWGLAGKKSAAHFSPEFGLLYVGSSVASKISDWLMLALACATTCYILAFHNGVVDGSNAFGGDNVAVWNAFREVGYFLLKKLHAMVAWISG